MYIQFEYILKHLVMSIILEADTINISCDIFIRKHGCGCDD